MLEVICFSVPEFVSIYHCLNITWIEVVEPTPCKGVRGFMVSDNPSSTLCIYLFGGSIMHSCVEVFVNNVIYM